MIVAGRYVPGMRFAVNATMGLSNIPYRRFLPWSVLGGTVVGYTCTLAYKVATTLSGSLLRRSSSPRSSRPPRWQRSFSSIGGGGERRKVVSMQPTSTWVLQSGRVPSHRTSGGPARGIRFRP